MSSYQENSSGRAVSHNAACITPGEDKWERFGAQWVARERHKGGLGSVTEHPSQELQLKSHFHLHSLFKIALMLWNIIVSSISYSPWLCFPNWEGNILAEGGPPSCPVLEGNNFSKFPKKLCLSSCLLCGFSIYKYIYGSPNAPTQNLYRCISRNSHRSLRARQILP